MTDKSEDVKKLDASLERFIHETGLGSRWWWALVGGREKSLKALDGVKSLDTVRDLLAVPESELEKLKNIGTCSMLELRQALSVNGLMSLPAERKPLFKRWDHRATKEEK